MQRVRHKHTVTRQNPRGSNQVLVQKRNRGHQVDGGNDYGRFLCDFCKEYGKNLGFPSSVPNEGLKIGPRLYLKGDLMSFPSLFSESVQNCF